MITLMEENKNMNGFVEKIVPEKAENDYKGYKLAEISFIVLTIVTLVRSLLHILLPDGGAQSIATIDLNIEGSEIIIGMFAFWGLSQLLMGIFYLIVYLRYKNLIPLMYLFIFIEYLMRIVIGGFKPFETVGMAPGAIGNLIIAPLSLILLYFSLKEPRNK